jgi:hypothetical protein
MDVLVISGTPLRCLCRQQYLTIGEHGRIHFAVELGMRSEELGIESDALGVADRRHRTPISFGMCLTVAAIIDPLGVLTGVITWHMNLTEGVESVREAGLSIVGVHNRDRDGDLRSSLWIASMLPSTSNSSYEVEELSL